MINFPNAPVIGQTYDFGDYRYTFDGVKWTSVIKYGTAASKVQSSTPPDSPEAGLQWYDDESGRTYFWHVNEGTSDGSWVEDAPQGLVEIQNETFNSVGDMISRGSSGGTTVSTGATSWIISNTDEGGLLLDSNLYANPITDVFVADWKLDLTGSTVSDTEVQQAVDVANEFGVFVIFPSGDILIREVEHYSNSLIRGNAAKRTTLIIDGNVAHNRGLWGSLASIGETGLIVEDLTFEARVNGTGYGWSLTNFAFVKSKNLRFINLNRGENFTDVLISRFVDHYYKSCVVGSWGFGDEGLNINVYEHPVARNCTDTYYLRGDPSNSNNSYGTHWLNGDFEYNGRVFNIDTVGQSFHVADNCTFEGDTSGSFTKNEVRVVGSSKLEIRNPKFGDTSASADPNVLTSDSDGEVKFTGDIGKQTSALRVAVPAKGQYNGTSLLRDNGLTDLPFDLSNYKSHRDIYSSLTSITKNEIVNYVTGTAEIGSRRESTFFNSAGWESGSSRNTSDPLGGTTAFEVTSSARMSTAVTAGEMITVQFFARSTRGDRGTLDVPILDQVSNANIGVLTLNYNGACDWKLFSHTFDPADVPSFSDGVRLVFPAVAGIRYWGQQVVSGASSPTPILPPRVTNERAVKVEGLGSITRMDHYQQINLTSFNAPALSTSGVLARSTDTTTQMFEVTVSTTFTGGGLSEVYHVALSYLYTADADSVTPVSLSEVGAGGSSRVMVSPSATTANTEKGIRFTGITFANNVDIKIRPLS